MDLITLNSNTSGTIDASTLSVIEGTTANANTIYDTKSGGDGFTGLGDEAITLTDTTAAAAALIDLYTNGTSGVIDATTVHTITGTAANANTIYSQTSKFTGLGTENITISGETNNSLAVATLNTLNGNTTGTINANTVTTLTGAISALNTAYAASVSTGDGISTLGNEAITISDGSVTDVAALNTLNGNTTGLIDAGTNVTSFTGAISALNTMFAAAGDSGDKIDFGGTSGAATQTVTISDTTDVSVTDLNTLNSNTTGNIDATNVTSLASASISDIKTLLTNGNNTTNNFAATSFQSLATVAVSGTSVSVTDLNDAIDQAVIATSGTSTVFSVASGATITTGDDAEFTALRGHEGNGNIAITDQNLTVSSGFISVDNANLLNATTEGTVTASIVTTETVDELATLSGTGAYTIVINIRDADAKQSTAAEFNTINSATTVAIDASAVVEIASSNLSDVKTLLTAGNDTAQFSANSFSSLDDVVIADATINVSDFNAAVTQANTDTGQTTRDNNATLFALSNATAFNGGTASDFATLLTSETNGLISGGITTQALPVDSGTVAVSAANDLNATTTGVVTATITEGDMSTLASLTDQTGSPGTDNAYTVTITDTSVAASALNTLAGKTSVAVTGSAITTLTGAISDVNIAYANTSGITGLGNEAVTISDTDNSSN